MAAKRTKSPKRITRPAPADKKKRTATSRSSAPALKPMTTDEKARLIKPPDSYPELTERAVQAWSEHRSELRIASVTPARLLTLLSRAKTALKRENRERQKVDVRMQILADARLRAEHEAWKTLLDVYAVAKAQSRLSPQLVQAFEFLGEALTRRPAAPKTEAPK